MNTLKITYLTYKAFLTDSLWIRVGITHKVWKPELARHLAFLNGEVSNGNPYFIQ